MPTEVIKLFRPVAVGSESTWWAKSGSKVTSVDPGEPINHDEYATWIQKDSVTTRQAYRIDRTFPDLMGTVNEVRVFCRYNPQVSLNANVRLGVALTAGPTWVESGDLKHTSAEWDNVSAALARPGGGSWTEADFRDTTFQFSVKYGSQPLWIRITSLWLQVKYIPTDEGAGAIPPEFPSRRIRRARLPIPILEANLRADVIDVDLLEDIEVIHSEGPHEDGEGWKKEKWQRRRLRVIENNLDLNNMQVRLRAVDLHDYACMFWHTGISPYNYKSDEDFPDGPALLHPGSTETFTRPLSTGHILNGSNIVVQLAADKKRIGPDGILLEGGAVNYVFNSSFFNGWTNWTLAGAGTSALDSANTLFDDEVATGLGGTNQTAKFTYVDGVGGRSAYQTTTQAFNNNEYIALTIWHKQDTAGFPGRYRIVNTVTGNYWNAATPGWQAAAVSNNLSEHTGEFEREVIIFPNDVATSTLQIRVFSPTSAGSGDTVVWIAHVQIEWGPDGQTAGTSPIPTWAAAVTRNSDSLKFSNHVGRRVWPAKRGTAIVRLKWFWSSPPGFRTGIPPDFADKWGMALLTAYHDANNVAYLHWYAGDIIRFSIRAAGTWRHSEISHVVVNETTTVIACRWTSANGGELGLPSRTIDVFVNGVKGTSAQATGDIVEQDSGANVALYWSGIIGGGGFGGDTLIPEPLAAYSHVEVLPWCLTDEEIKARP